MRLKQLTPALLLCLLTLTISAQDKPRCKVETTYDRFADTTEDLCTVQKVGSINIHAVATYKGKRGTSEAQYALTFVYLNPEAFPDERLRYDKAESLFILADDLRRQIPLDDYKHSTSPPLRGKVLRVERLTATTDRETLSRITDASHVELRLGETEIKLTDEAKGLLRDFIARIEQP